MGIYTNSMEVFVVCIVYDSAKNLDLFCVLYALISPKPSKIENHIF